MQYIIAIVLLVIFSAFFSATETAFTSANRIRLKNLAGDGNKKAKQVLEMGMYGEETESYQYLQKIVSDADQLAAQTAADNQENNGANGTGESGAESGNADNSGTDATGGTSENSENNGTGESGAENENLENREDSENE